MFLRKSFIISKRRKFYRVKFSIYIGVSYVVNIGHSIHVLNNFWHQFFVFFFRILFIKNTVICIAKPHATKNMFAVMAMLSISNILAFYGKNSEKIKL